MSELDFTQYCADCLYNEMKDQLIERLNIKHSWDGSISADICEVNSFLDFFSNSNVSWASDIVTTEEKLNCSREILDCFMYRLAEDYNYLIKYSRN